MKTTTERKMTFENLEARRVMTANVDIDLDDGVLEIEGSDDRELIKVYEQGDEVKVEILKYEYGRGWEVVKDKDYDIDKVDKILVKAKEEMTCCTYPPASRLRPMAAMAMTGCTEAVETIRCTAKLGTIFSLALTATTACTAATAMTVCMVREGMTGCRATATTITSPEATVTIPCTASTATTAFTDKTAMTTFTAVLAPTNCTVDFITRT